MGKDNEIKTTMKAAAFLKKDGKLEIIDLPIPEPKKGWARIKVHACGVCHSDNYIKNGLLGNSFPRVPGHEVIGHIDKLHVDDEDEDNLIKIGSVVGVGWFGGACHKCQECKDNEWVHCKKVLICGKDYNGGYAEYMIAPIDALALIPNSMNPIESAPLLCAGITVFNSLRNQNIKIGSLVGVQGIGGLGHLAIQYCRKIGYEVVALSSGPNKKQLALDLGANHYIDTSNDDYVDQIKSIGSLKCILVTAPIASTIPKLIKSLGTNGKLVLLSVLDKTFNGDSIPLVTNSISVVGYLCGDSRDSADCLHFSNLNNVKPICKSFPLERANEAFEKIGSARFRNVINLLN